MNFLNRKAVKEYIRTKGKRINPAALAMLDERVLGIIQIAIERAGQFPNLTEVEFMTMKELLESAGRKKK